MDSQILFAAEEIGIFEVLAADGGTIADIARETGLPRDSVRRLTTVLCALELLEKDDGGRIFNSPEASEKLVPDSPRYIGGMFRHLKEDLYPLWAHLPDALSEQQAQWQKLSNGGAPRNEEIYEDPEALRDFHQGMFAVSYEPAREFGPQFPELEDAEYVVDIGGSSGAFLIALAEQYPNLRGSVFDLPQLRPIAEEFFEKHGVADRLTFEAGDFWNDPLPAGADAYSLGFVLHDWDTEGGSIILQKIAGAARPGSALLIGEYLLNDRRTGPLHVARQDINMLIAARGRERTTGEYADWVREFGFSFERVARTSHGKHFFIATYDAPDQNGATSSRSGRQNGRMTSRARHESNV